MFNSLYHLFKVTGFILTFSHMHIIYFGHIHPFFYPLLSSFISLPVPSCASNNPPRAQVLTAQKWSISSFPYLSTVIAALCRDFYPC